MNDNSSNSSDDNHSDETILLREYEKKKVRKERCDKNTNVKEIAVDPDMLNKIKISQNQLKKLKPKKERTPKQIEASKENIKKLLDLRKSKAEEEAKIVLEVKPKQKYTRKKKEVQPIEESDSDSSGEEVAKPKPKKFQKKKPKIEDSSSSEDELETKMRKLEQLDNVLKNQNPYYSLIMSRQMRR
tara:strand:- start:314 stop:871 length:558 start_codon:yes stop_codon:yes gene_type:complete